MAYPGWLQLGGVEIANSARVIAAMRNGIRPTTVDVHADDTWRDIHRWQADPPYSTPAEDGAPWFTPDRPESGDFAGVWPMLVDGLDAAPLEIPVEEATGHGGSFGPPRASTRTIRVEALLIARTPQGLRFGFDWLSSVLRGEPCATPDQPRQLVFLNTVPDVHWDHTDQEVRELGDAQARMVTRVVCTKLPEITDRFGLYYDPEHINGEGRDSCAARIAFELTAAVPWIWQFPVPVIDQQTLHTGTYSVVQFERQDGDGVCPSACAAPEEAIVDPNMAGLTVLPRPITPAAALGCTPIESRRTTITLPSDTVPQFSEMVPTVRIHSGTAAERSIRVQWVEGPDPDECATVGEVMVGYLPAASTITLDGVTGLATVDTPTSVGLDGTPVVTGRMGGPWRAPDLRCGRAYTVIIDTEASVNSAAWASVELMVRQT